MTIEHDPFGRISETDLTPLNYYDLVRQLDILMQRQIAPKLEAATEHLGKIVTFVTAGSDARLEKGSMASPLELIALVNADLDLKVFRQSLEETLKSTDFNGRIAPNLEIKGVGSSMVHYEDNPAKAQPGRIADARRVIGSQQDVISAKERLGQQIIAMPGKTVEKIAGLERDARHAAERGTNRIGGEDILHFDLATGTVYYNPEARQLSFKIGPLRLVQNKLLVEEVRYTRRENEPGFISRLSSSIEHRLDQLTGEGRLNISRSTVRELQEHYAFFLKLYHRSENAYKLDHAVALQLDERETQEIARRLQAMQEILAKLKIIKPGTRP